MKANELMVGDWVKHADGSCCVVSKIESGKGFACRIGNSQYLWDYNNKFEPIPLTEDILKANGWSNENSCLFWREDVGVMNYNGSYHICRINNVKLHYVHELQHALRLCGLGELADDFKLC